MQSRHSAIKDKLLTICKEYAQPKPFKKLTGKQNTHHQACEQLAHLTNTISIDHIPVLARALSDYLSTTNSKKLLSLFNREKIQADFTNDDWEALKHDENYKTYFNVINGNLNWFAGLLAEYDHEPSQAISPARNLDWALATMIALSNQDLLKTALYYSVDNGDKFQKIIDALASKGRLSPTQKNDLFNLIQLDGCLFITQQLLHAMQEKMQTFRELTLETHNEILVSLNNIKNTLKNPDMLVSQLSDDPTLQAHKQRIQKNIQQYSAEASYLSTRFDEQYLTLCAENSRGPLERSESRTKPTDDDFKYTKVSISAPVSAVALPLAIGLTSGGDIGDTVEKGIIGLFAAGILAPLTFTLGVAAGVISLPFTLATDSVRKIKNTIDSASTPPDLSALREKEETLMEKLVENQRKQREEVDEKRRQEEAARQNKEKATIDATKASIQALLSESSKQKLETICELYSRHRKAENNFDVLRKKLAMLEESPLHSTGNYLPQDVTDLLQDFTQFKIGVDLLTKKQPSLKFPFVMAPASNARRQNGFFFPFKPDSYVLEGSHRTDEIIKQAITEMEAWLNRPSTNMSTLNAYKETIEDTLTFLEKFNLDDLKKTLSEKESIVEDTTTHLEKLWKNFKTTETKMENIARQRPSFG